MALERFTAAVQIREKAVDRLNSVTQQLHAGWSELKARLPQGATAMQIAQIQAYCDSVTARKREIEVHVSAAHGVFCGPAKERLAAAPINSIVVTDTIPKNAMTPPSAVVLSVGDLLGDAILRIHQGRSVSKLFPQT